MKKLYLIKEFVFSLILVLSFVVAQAQTTHLNFETMVDGDTIFIDQGDLADTVKPLNWVFDGVSPDKNSQNLRVPELMHVPTLVDGIVGKAMQFDGKKEWVIIQHPYGILKNRKMTHFSKEKDNFTASIWFNNAVTTVAPPKKPEQMIFNTVGTGLLIKNDTLWAGCYVRDRADADRYRGGALIGIPFTTTNEWTNAALVFEGKAVNDSTSLFKLYINGKEVASEQVAAASLYVDDYDAAYVGGHYKWGVMDNLGVVSYVKEGDVKSYFKGMLDEFVTTTDAKSATDIYKDYNEIVNPDLDVSATYLDFETMIDGDTFFIDQGNVLNAPLNWVFDGVSTEKNSKKLRVPELMHVPTLVDGIVGKAMQFDGKKEWVILQHPYGKLKNRTVSHFSEEKDNFTASVWFNNAVTTVAPPKKPEQMIFNTLGTGLLIKNDTLWAGCYVRDRKDADRFRGGALIGIPFTTTNKWTNAVLVFEGKAIDDTTSLFKLYINGEEVASEPVAAASLYVDDYDAAYVGGHYKWGVMDNLGVVSYVKEGDVKSCFKGMIDELKTTAKAKSATDIYNEYNELANPDLDLSYTYLDFETMVEGDTIFVDQGNLLNKPLNWVFDGVSTEKNSKKLRVPELMHVPTLVDGIVGKAMQFDGKKEWVILQHPYGKLKNRTVSHFSEEKDNFTASVWFNNAVTTVAPPKKPEQMIFNTLGTGLMLRNDTLWAGCYVKDRKDADRFRGGALIGIPFTTTNKWTNAVLVFEGKAIDDTTSLFKLYINGEEVASEPVAAASLYVDDYDAAYVGGHYKWGVMDNLGVVSYVKEGDVKSYFKGMIDELKTTAKAKSATDIYNEYNELANPDLDLSYTYLDFETMVAGDTIFVDQGNVYNKPLNWVFDDVSPDKNSKKLRVPELMHVPTLVDGIVGKAMQFDGKKEWVILQHPYGKLKNRTVSHFSEEKDNFTASVWFNNAVTTVAPPKKPEQMIFNTLGTGLLIKNDTLWAGCYVKDRKDADRFRGGALIGIPFTTTNKWTNAVVVFEGKAIDDTTSLFKLYINGEEVASEPVAAASLYVDDYDAAYVGGHYKWGVMDNLGVVSYVKEGDVKSYFKGMIDELKTSATAKSAADIYNEYNELANPDLDLTYTHLDFETMVTGDTIFVDQGNVYNKPLNWVFDDVSTEKNSHKLRVPEKMHVPTLVDGIIGKAMQFDGKKEWIILQHPYAFIKNRTVTHFAEESNNFSASIWFNNEVTTVAPPKKPEQMIFNTLGTGLLLRNDTLWAGCYVKDRGDASRFRGGALIGIPFTTTNEWTNAVLVFEGKAVNDTTSMFRLYINGEEVASEQVAAPSLYVDEYDAAYIGGHYKWGVMDNLGVVSYVKEGDVKSYFKGMMDDFITTQTVMSPTDIKNIYDKTVSIISIDKPVKSLVIYPNPTSSSINIDLSELGTSVKVEVFNLIGKLVQTKDIISPTSRETLDVSSLDKGLYFVRVKSGKEIYLSEFQVIR